MSTNVGSFVETPTTDSVSKPVLSPHGEADQPSASPDRQTIRHNILSAIRETTRRAKLPPPWASLGLHSQLRKFRGSPDGLMESLRKDFDVEQLLEAGVFERNTRDELILSAKIGAPAAKLAFISDGTHYSDIHSARGALASTDTPAVQLAKMSSEEVQGGPAFTLLAVDDDDVNVLTGLNCRCSWAAGLDCITGRDVGKILFNGRVQPSPPLVLVGWRLALLDQRPSPLIVKILERFARAERLYGRDAKQVLGVWRPSSLTINTLKIAIDFQDSEKVRIIVSNSLAGSIQSPAEALYSLKQPPERDYGAALRNLVQIVDRGRKGPAPNDARDALEQVERSFNRCLAQKLLDDADATNNIAKRFLLLHAATLLKEWHQRQPVLRSARFVADMTTPPLSAGMPPDELKELFRIGDEILKIVKHIECLKG